MKVYDDIELLRRVATELKNAAASRQILLPLTTLTTPAEFQAEAEKMRTWLNILSPADRGRQKGLSEPIEKFIRKIYASNAPNDLDSAVAQLRKTLVDLVMSELKPWPESMVQLTVRMIVDGGPYLSTDGNGNDIPEMERKHHRAPDWPDETQDLYRQIRQSSWLVGATHWSVKDAINSEVVSNSIFVTIRLADKWSTRLTSGSSYWGFLYRQLPSLIRRAAKRNSPDPRAQCQLSGDHDLEDTHENPLHRLQNDEQIKSMLDKLTYREREIITSRFWVKGQGPKTQAEVASDFGVSKQRIQQLEKQAIDNLRKIASEMNVDISLM